MSAGCKLKHPVRHRFYMFVCLTPWSAPIDWWARRHYPVRAIWAHDLAWAIQRRQNNFWNRYGARCRLRGGA